MQAAPVPCSQHPVSGAATATDARRSNSLFPCPSPFPSNNHTPPSLPPYPTLPVYTCNSPLSTSPYHAGSPSSLFTASSFWRAAAATDARRSNSWVLTRSAPPSVDVLLSGTHTCDMRFGGGAKVCEQKGSSLNHGVCLVFPRQGAQCPTLSGCAAVRHLLLVGGKGEV